MRGIDSCKILWYYTANTTQDKQRNKIMTYNYNKMMEAVENGNIRSIARYVSMGADVSEMLWRVLDSDRTNLNVVCYLLDKGANPDYVIQRSNEPKVVEIMLNHGADANCRDRSGKTPLVRACNLEALSNSLNGMMRGRAVSLVRILIKHGANVNYCNPLHVAAYNGSVEIVRMLIEAGAKVNTTNCIGQTALTLARKSRSKRKEEVIEMLIAAGGYATSVEYAKYTPA